MSPLRQYKLYKHDELPPYLQYNPHIRTGYRHNFSFTQCLKSFFSVHNETGNIWTHFMVFLILVAFGYYTIMHQLDIVQHYPDVALDEGASSALFWHRAMFAVFVLAFAFCMLASSLYHVFLSHSEAACYWMTILDYTGIAGLVIGCFYPPLYYGFYCFPRLQLLYLSSISIFGLTVLIGPWFKFFHTERFNPVRMFLYISVAVCGFIPTVHSYFLMPQLVHAPPITDVYLRIFLMYLVYLIGFAFYATRFPECIYPGRFDIWLNSHQWWHIFVVIGTVIHWSTCLIIHERWVAILIDHKSAAACKMYYE